MSLTQGSAAASDEQTREEERRVAAILARARRDVAARDLVTFVAARAWRAVMVFGALLTGLVGPSPTREGSRRSGDDHGSREE